MAVAFIALGFVQVTYQGDIKQTLENQVKGMETSQERYEQQQRDNANDNKIQQSLNESMALILESLNTTKAILQYEVEQEAFQFNLTQEEERKDNEEMALVREILEQQINATRERFIINQEEEKKDNEEMSLIRQILEQQGNLTEERREGLIEALEENVQLVPEIKDDIESMNNKINELFFLKNATVMPTNVYNATDNKKS